MSRNGVLFVGGGQAAVVLLDLFVSDDDIDVMGVVDPNPEAAGIRHARELHIPVYREMDSIIKDPHVKIVVEVTGHPAVKKKVMENMREDQEVMTASGARILVEITNQQKKAREQIEALSGTISISSQKIDETARDIFDVLREMKILSINANVEAARLGAQGKSFAIVADRMSELTHDVQRAIDNISIASKQNREFLQAFARSRASAA